MDTISVIGLHTFRSGQTFIFNQMDETFDNLDKIDLHLAGFKYESGEISSKSKEIFIAEGCVGELEILNIEL
jgi:hypothetical protein